MAKRSSMVLGRRNKKMAGRGSKNVLSSDGKYLTKVWSREMIDNGMVYKCYC